jgi:hypothetical protein
LTAAIAVDPQLRTEITRFVQIRIRGKIVLSPKRTS